MATKDGPSNGLTSEDVPRREEFADFALVLKDGQELKCHKFRLAEVSPFFCAMLRQDCIETQTNKMMVTEFEPDIVESFLDWIYADMELVPVKTRRVYERNFDKKRLNHDLLRLSHMYQVKDLQGQCIQHLAENINDTNAVEMWTLGEMIGHADLKRAALEYLGKKRNNLFQVAGMKESCKNPRLMESLVTYMSDREKLITVNVQCWDNNGSEPLTTQQVRVKLSDTGKALRLRINDCLEKWEFGHEYRCQRRSIVNPERYMPHGFPEECGLDEIQHMYDFELTDGSLLHCLIFQFDDPMYETCDQDGQGDGDYYD